MVASTDVLVEGVHFRLDWSTPEHVGRKAIAVNMADIAAMGAVPTALLVGLACPSTTKAEVAEGLAAGMWQEATRAGAGLVGGDVVTAKEIVISVTALGDLRAASRSPGAAPCPGTWSRCAVASAGRRPGSPCSAAGSARRCRSSAPTACRSRRTRLVRRPRAAGATAMIDVSDGLLADLGHICDASNVAIDVRTKLLEVPQRLVDVGTALGADPVHWVLTGGEDHALAATFPEPAAVPEGWRTIGTVTRGSAVTVDGGPYEGGTGWQHFR